MAINYSWSASRFHSWPLLFNIFINDLLLIVKNIDICNFADDNTIYCCENSLDTVINSLELGMQGSCLSFKSSRAKKLQESLDDFASVMVDRDKETVTSRITFVSIMLSGDNRTE